MNDQVLPNAYNHTLPHPLHQRKAPCNLLSANSLDAVKASIPAKSSTSYCSLPLPSAFTDCELWTYATQHRNAARRPLSPLQLGGLRRVLGSLADSPDAGLNTLM
ncbi:hypothetical protein PSPO01_03451 [Paraphaeosphaeria sporulosa]